MGTPVVLIELFGGVMVLSEAADFVGLNVIATFYSEIFADATLTVSTNWPQAEPLGPIEDISEDSLDRLVGEFPDAFFVLGGGWRPY